MARASIRRRGSTWTVILDVGRHPATGKRSQRWTATSPARAAEAALRDRSREVDQGTDVARTSVTVADSSRTGPDGRAAPPPDNVEQLPPRGGQGDHGPSGRSGILSRPAALG